MEKYTHKVLALKYRPKNFGELIGQDIVVETITNSIKLKNFLLNFEALASLLLRFGIGIAFIIHGYAKFPLPPAGLVEYFGLPPALATFVALSELLSGAILIVSGFLKNPIGDTLTRFAGIVIVIIMTNIFIIAHPDWFITQKLFTSEQIFLFIGGFYFLIKGNKV